MNAVAVRFGRLGALKQAARDADFISGGRENKQSQPRAPHIAAARRMPPSAVCFERIIDEARSAETPSHAADDSRRERFK